MIFHKGIYYVSLKTEITRQRPFTLTDIEYDQIKDEISRMKLVDYNTATGINVMNVDNIEDFGRF